MPIAARKKKNKKDYSADGVAESDLKKAILDSSWSGRAANREKKKKRD